MNYLLDTCVISELIARRPNPQVVEWTDGVDESRLYLSVIAIGEIRKGIEKLSDPQRRAEIQEWLDNELLVRFAGRIVALDVGVMLCWGELMGGLERAGQTMPAIDSLIAATALHGGFSLVTRNEEDFRHTGVPIVNPWR